jgi:hypothetical protein
MISFAFEYFDLNYKNICNLLTKNLLEIKILFQKSQNPLVCLDRNNIRRTSKIYGKKTYTFAN